VLGQPFLPHYTVAWILPQYFMSNREIRSSIRAFLLTATIAEMRREVEISLGRKDTFRAECINELINERLSDGEKE
jgi:hypothetical protein